MKIAVCLKHVVTRDGAVRVDDAGTWIRDRDAAFEDEEKTAEGLAALHALLPERVAERMIFDLGLTRPLSYYTGAVFEVYEFLVTDIDPDLMPALTA